MNRGHLLKITSALVLGFLVIAFWNDRGAATIDPVDQKLEAFVEAAFVVDQIKAVWQPRIAGADVDQAADLRQQANNEIRQSIDAVEGISFEDYQRISKSLASDPDLLGRVTDIMRGPR
jgi:hypothetical protein